LVAMRNSARFRHCMSGCSTNPILYKALYGSAANNRGFVLATTYVFAYAPAQGPVVAARDQAHHRAPSVIRAGMDSWCIVFFIEHLGQLELQYLLIVLLCSSVVKRHIKRSPAGHSYSLACAIHLKSRLLNRFVLILAEVCVLGI